MDSDPYGSAAVCEHKSPNGEALMRRSTGRARRLGSLYGRMDPEDRERWREGTLLEQQQQSDNSAAVRIAKRDVRWVDLRSRRVWTPRCVCIHPPPRLEWAYCNVVLSGFATLEKITALKCQNFNGFSTPGVSSGIRVKPIWETWKSRYLKCAHWAKRCQMAYFIAKISPVEVKPPPHRPNGSNWKVIVHTSTWGVLPSWLAYRWRVSHGNFAHSAPIDADSQRRALRKPQTVNGSIDSPCQFVFSPMGGYLVHWCMNTLSRVWIASVVLPIELQRKKWDL